MESARRATTLAAWPTRRDRPRRQGRAPQRSATQRTPSRSSAPPPPRCSPCDESTKPSISGQGKVSRVASPSGVSIFSRRDLFASPAGGSAHRRPANEGIDSAFCRRASARLRNGIAWQARIEVPFGACTARDQRGYAMTIDRRRFLELAGGAAFLPALSDSAWAQGYPARPVQLVVAYPPGSGPDIIGRLTAQHLSDRLGQQFVIDNKPGASANIGTEYVAQAEPDGYTIRLPISTNAVNVALYRNLSFDFIRDIAPIAGIAKTPFVIVAPPSFPAATLSEFIAYLKANPGKVNMASNGIGSSPHVCGELFQLM